MQAFLAITLKMLPSRRSEINTVDIVAKEFEASSWHNCIGESAACYTAFRKLLPHLRDVHFSMADDYLAQLKFSIPTHPFFVLQYLRTVRAEALVSLRLWLVGCEKEVTVVENVPWYMEGPEWGEKQAERYYEVQVE